MCLYVHLNSTDWITWIVHANTPIACANQDAGAEIYFSKVHEHMLKWVESHMGKDRINIWERKTALAQDISVKKKEVEKNK